MKQLKPIVSVTLNPSIDRTVFLSGLMKGEVNRAKHFQRQAGGKGLNVATMLSLAGVQSIVSGFLGNQNSRIFEDHFQKHRLVDRFIRIGGETREGIKLIDESSQETTDVNLPGNPPGTEAIEALQSKLLEIIQHDSWVLFSGSMPPGLSENAFRKIVITVKETGAKIAVDTSGAALKIAVETGVDLVKPNLDELEALVERKLDGASSVFETVRDLRTQYGTDWVVSLGEEGAVYITGEGECRTFAPEVEVVSTVGAGDAMLAGYLYGLANGKPLEDRARLATVFAWSRLERLEPQLPVDDLFQKRLGEVVVV